MELIISISSILLVGIINAFKDASAINTFNKDWWNKGRSWKMKWKLNTWESAPIHNDKRPWYYLWIYKPNYVEKFPYSSTILVSLTDGWHVLQLIQFTIIQLLIAFLLSSSILSFACYFVALKVTFSLVFEITYKKITKK